jgi:hypothetical protein
MLVAGIGVPDAAGPVVVQLTPQNSSGESGRETCVFWGNLPNM